MGKCYQLLLENGAKNIRKNGKKHWVGDMPCPKCGDVRVVWGISFLHKGRQDCRKCSNETRKYPTGKEHPNYKRGWCQSKEYRVTSVPRNHPFHSMGSGKNNMVGQHRLVMAEHLGRPLASWEHVHHINENKSDNRIENLALMSADIHSVVTALERENRKLRQKIDMLKTHES